MKLVGKINGVDITLVHEGFGVYTAIIPRQLNGVYIVELHVENNGACDNYSKVFVRVDFKNMKVERLDPKYEWTPGKVSLEYEAIDNSLQATFISSPKYIITSIDKERSIKGVHI